MAVSEFPPVMKLVENATGVATSGGGKVEAGRFLAYNGTPSTDAFNEAQPVKHCTAGARSMGVSQNESADPADASFPAGCRDLQVSVVRKPSIVRVTAGEALTAGDEICSSSVGKAIKSSNAAVRASATLNTGVVGSNNAITWTSRKAGAAGNATTITLVNPGGTTAQSVDVDGDDVIVTLSTSSGTITATPATIIASILEDNTASQLVLPTNTGASTGASAVVAVSKTSLAGGLDQGVVLGVATKTVGSGEVAEVDLGAV